MAQSVGYVELKPVWVSQWAKSKVSRCVTASGKFSTSATRCCKTRRSSELQNKFSPPPDRPLFFPCICTGSIKYIHQECLTQWMRYSRKEFCELCGHKFSFTPIYSPDMPRVLPLRVVAGGLVSSIATAVKYWLHYTLVAGKFHSILNVLTFR